MDLIPCQLSIGLIFFFFLKIRDQNGYFENKDQNRRGDTSRYDPVMHSLRYVHDSFVFGFLY